MKRLMLVITFVLGTLGQAQAQENRGSANYMPLFCQTWLKLAAERDLQHVPTGVNRDSQDAPKEGV
jgi:hypothetical protein